MNQVDSRTLFKVKQITLGIVLGAVAAAPILADDTEIFVGLAGNQTSAKPNVLFILDTSGSMSTQVTLTESYDPNVTYAGSCDASRIYWDDEGDTPECDDDEWFYTSQSRCAAAVSALNATPGYYTDRVALWDEDEWDELDDDEHNPTHVECKADQGVHGQTAASGATYIGEDNDGPWTSNVGDAESWNDIGDVYTLYSANYLNWYHNHQVTQLGTRMDIVKNVTKDLIDSVSGINLALMRFDTNGTLPGGGSGTPGGAVVYPMTDIDATGTRTAAKAVVDTFTATSWTPLAQTYYESLLYWRGQAALHGVDSYNTIQSHADTLTTNGQDYVSPIELSCVKNYTVLLTDGLPTHDRDDDTAINSLLATSSVMTDKTCGHGNNTNPVDSCLDELAEFMYTTDNATASLGNDIQGEQKVTTHTIGFAVDDTLLDAAAAKGGGNSYFVTDTTELSAVLTEIITEILAVNSTFTSAAVSVNAFNRLTHNNELYFTVFKPGARAHWDGNVKRFALGLKTDANGNPIDADGNGEPDLDIVDANGNSAVDDSTGLFKDTSESVYTPAFDAPDGQEVELGGIASRLYDLVLGQHVANTRNVYTYTGTVADLSNAVNQMHEDNANTTANPTGALTKTMFNAAAMSDADFQDLIRWSRGVDLKDADEDADVTDGRPRMGGILHSKPVIVTYGANPSTGVQDNTLFVVTNDGYLHAVTTNDPTGNADALESFAYVPANHLNDLRTIFDNSSSPTLHYNIDGALETWINDANGDDNIVNTDGSIDTGDHVYIYFSERRGGRAVHAVDVTDRAHPEFLWLIDGDDATGTDPFTRLGQSWSKPKHRKMLVGTQIKDVVIFAGGYDTGHDSADTSRSNSITLGNAVYIVDAENGNLLWWAGRQETGGPVPNLDLSDMYHSIAADVTAIDHNGDTLIDMLFVADLGGQIWRFDIDNSTTGTLADRVTGGVIADVQKSNQGSAAPGAADNRRFYDPIDVSVAEPVDDQPYLALAVGSGFRAHPLNTTVTERYYLIKDTSVDGPPTDADGDITYTKLYEDDLLDVTDVVTQSHFDGLSSNQEGHLAKGWYVTLEGDGEKAVSGSLTLNGVLIFTTYTPAEAGQTTEGQVCSPALGTGKFYEVRVQDGRPAIDLDGIGGLNALTKTDRSRTLGRSGIPPQPVTVFPDLTGVTTGTIVIGNEFVPPDVKNPFVRTFWYQHNAVE